MGCPYWSSLTGMPLLQMPSLGFPYYNALTIMSSLGCPYIGCPHLRCPHYNALTMSPLGMLSNGCPHWEALTGMPSPLGMPSLGMPLLGDTLTIMSFGMPSPGIPSMRCHHWGALTRGCPQLDAIIWKPSLGCPQWDALNSCPPTQTIHAITGFRATKKRILVT